MFYLQVFSLHENCELFIKYSKDTSHNSPILLFIAGMGDHLLSSPFIKQLFNQWGQTDIAQLRLSSNPYYGYYTLKDDAKDIELAVQQLIKMKRKIILMGHSTGCQSIMYFLDKYIYKNESTSQSKLNQSLIKEFILKCILLGPVSDRQGLKRIPMDVTLQNKSQCDIPGHNTSQNNASNTPKEGSFQDALDGTLLVAQRNPKARFLLGRSVICSTRYLDLYSKNGLDDIFSTDLSISDHFSRMNKLGLPLTLIHMRDDEYNKPENNEYLKIVPNAKVRVIEGDHMLSHGVDELIGLLDDDIGSEM